MTNDLLIIVPSRGRPQNIRRLADAMARTCWGDTTLIVGVDSDDPCLPEYERDWERNHDSRWPYRLAITAGVHQVVAWINHLSFEYSREFAVIGSLGDDSIPRTEGWDVRVMGTIAEQRLTSPVAFCYADDGYPLRARGGLCTHIFMSSNVIARLGYMGPPSLRHMYVDNVWMQWGRATSLKWMDDVLIEHMHYSSGRSEQDQTYVDAESFAQQDGRAYQAYCADQLLQDIDKLKGEG